MKLQIDKAVIVQGKERKYLCLDIPKDKIESIKQELDKGNYQIEIREKKESRSRNANAYFWELCGQLAAKTRIAPRVIYRELIRDVGDNFDICRIKTANLSDFKESWESKGIGWICDLMDEPSGDYVDIICYYGSSTYDSKQMSRLISLLEDEAKEQDINIDDAKLKSLMEVAK